MNRVLLHHGGVWMEWSTILDVPTTTGLSRDGMRDHLAMRGVTPQDADAAMDVAAESGSSTRDLRDPAFRRSLEQVVAGNRAGDDGGEIGAAEIVRRYLVERETLY